MFFRRKNREIPELNTTSTADISFMLLVFFLVTSSMDTDKGLSRQLPPLDDEPKKEVDISRSNVMQIRLDAHDSLWIDNQAATLRGKPTDRTVCGGGANRQGDELRSLLRDAEHHRGCFPSSERKDGDGAVWSPF